MADKSDIVQAAALLGGADAAKHQTLARDAEKQGHFGSAVLEGIKTDAAIASHFAGKLGLVSEEATLPVAAPATPAAPATSVSKPARE